MIIGLTGQRRSGKSTAAELLVEISANFTRLAFADALKKQIADQYHMDVRDLYSDSTKEKYRQLMQDFGTQARSINPCVFVEPIFKYIDAEPERNYIIEDVRYVEELKELLKRQGILIKVFADPKVRADRGAVESKELDNHSSETEVAAIEAETVRSFGGFALYNNKTKMDFKFELSNTLQLINAKQAAKV